MSRKYTYHTIAERTRVQASLGCCNAPGCHLPRYRVGPWCTTHRDRIRRHGHPTLTPPSRTYRARLRKHVRASFEPFLTREVRQWLERLQARLVAWSDSPRLRELDAEHLGRLARVDPVDLLATIVAWSLWEFEYRSDRDPLPFFMAGRPERVRRFNACQLASWLRDTMNTRGLKHSGPSVRAMRRAVRLLLAYRFQPGLEALAFAIGRKVGARVREEIALEIQQLQEQQRVKRERAFNDRYPCGINADGSFDIYRRSS